MEFKLEKCFKYLENDWSRLFSITPEVSPFLDPSSFKIQIRFFYPYYLKFRCAPRYGVIEENGSVVAIVPLLKYSSGKFQLWGFPNGFNESGFLFHPDIDLKNIAHILKITLGYSGIDKS